MPREPISAVSWKSSADVIRSSLQLPREISDPNGVWAGPDGWRGRAVNGCRDFEFFALPWSTLRKRKRTTEDGLIRCIKCSGGRHVFRIENPRLFGADLDRPVYAKCYTIDNWIKRAGNLFSGGKARREYELGWALLERGLTTPVPLAWALPNPRLLLSPAITANYLLTLELKNEGTLPFWAENGQADRIPGFYTILAQFLAAMHTAGFYHDDGLAKNFSISPGADFANDDVLSIFQIFDIDHGRIYENGMPFGPRSYNVYQMVSSLRKSGLPDRDRRVQFLRDYMTAAGLDARANEGPLIRAIDRFAERKLHIVLFK